MMNDYKGIYHLIATDSNNEREYFNFEGKRGFMPREWVTMSGVKLAYIDAITTLFDSDADFRCALDGGEDYGYKMNIVYVSNGSKAKFERKLDPIFKDDTLREIAEKAIKKTGGTYLDLNDTKTREVLNKIFKEVQVRASDFTYEAINSKLANHQMSDHSKEVLNRFHHNTAYTEREYYYQLRLFSNAFKSYKEFRALYQNYIAYKNNLYKGTELPLKKTVKEDKPKVKTLEKKKEAKKRDSLKQCEGQMSMFDLL